MGSGGADKGVSALGVWDWSLDKGRAQGVATSYSQAMLPLLVEPSWQVGQAAWYPRITEGVPVTASLKAGRAYSQEPVHGDDERDVIGGQTHRRQHDDHGDQARLRNPSCPDAGGCGCDAVKRSSQT